MVPRFLLLTVLIPFLFFLAGFAPVKSERFLKGGFEHSYLVQIPQDFDPLLRYPLLIAIHGHKGTSRQLCQEWEYIANENRYILLCPQFSQGSPSIAYQEDRVLIAMIEDVWRIYPFDRDRIFLVGFSSGGEFAGRFLFAHGELVRAAAILSSWVDGSFPPVVPGMKSSQILVGAGENDPVRGPAWDFYGRLALKGYDAQFILFPGVGHELDPDMKKAVAEFFTQADERG